MARELDISLNCMFGSSLGEVMEELYKYLISN